MKRHFNYLFAAIAAVSFTFTGCDGKDPIVEPDETVDVTGVELTESTLALFIGDTETLVWEVSPAEATNKNVKWLSTADEYATVSDEGVVTAVAEGTTTILVITEDGLHSDICTVTVTPVPVKVTSVALDEAEVLVAPVETLQLNPTVLPAEATDKSLEWTSSDETVATVDQNGLVTPLAEANGTTTITATAKDGSEQKATCDVTVHPLGRVSFKTETTWSVGTGDLAQVWSDVVMASGARKDTYNGGNATDGYKADFRSNGNFGDLFSWAAMNTYKAVLCPAPWKVPDEIDFRTLDKALGGTGNDMVFNAATRYIEQWGAVTNSGHCNGDGTIAGTTIGWYWSQTEATLDNGRAMNVMTSPAHVNVGGAGTVMSKDRGVAVRCVK